MSTTLEIVDLIQFVALSLLFLSACVIGLLNFVLTLINLVNKLKLFAKTPSSYFFFILPYLLLCVDNITDITQYSQRVFNRCCRITSYHHVVS